MKNVGTLGIPSFKLCLSMNNNKSRKNCREKASMEEE